MAAASIHDLPAELHRPILEHLARRDLLALVLSSKRLRIAAEPFLYSRIHFDWTTECEPRINELLRTLLERPTLAEHIQSLHLLGEGFYCPLVGGAGPLKILAPKVAESSMEKGHKLIRGMKLPQDLESAWRQGLLIGNVDALTTLLISMTPNLSSLRMDQLLSVNNPILCEYFKRALLGGSGAWAKLNQFHKLREVVMPNHHTDVRRLRFNNVARMLPLFQLPALESLRVAIDNPVDFAWPSAVPTPASLRSLALDRIREQCLAPLLHATTNLKRFEWNFVHWPGIDEERTADLELDTLTAALAPLRDSLCELIIHAFKGELYRGPKITPRCHIRGSLSGLAGLSQLRSLVVPWALYMGFCPSHGRSLVGQLPRNLETLVFTDELSREHAYKWKGGLMVVIRNALRGITRDTVPNLRTITLAWDCLEGAECGDTCARKTETVYGSCGIEIIWESHVSLKHQRGGNGYNQPGVAPISLRSFAEKMFPRRI